MIDRVYTLRVHRNSCPSGGRALREDETVKTQLSIDMSEVQSEDLITDEASETAA